MWRCWSTLIFHLYCISIWSWVSNISTNIILWSIFHPWLISTFHTRPLISRMIICISIHVCIWYTFVLVYLFPIIFLFTCCIMPTLISIKDSYFSIFFLLFISLLSIDSWECYVFCFSIEGKMRYLPVSFFFIPFWSLMQLIKFIFRK